MHRVNAFGLLLGHAAAGWAAGAELVLAVAAVAGGGWALYNHRRKRREDAVRWLHGVFKDFYLSPEFREIRHMLEYERPHAIGPLLRRRIRDRSSSVEDEEMDLLQALDTLLTYFEHVLYLEANGQIARQDRESIFDYWFEVIRDERNEDLRRYIRRFEWRNVTRLLDGRPIRMPWWRRIARRRPSFEEQPSLP